MKRITYVTVSQKGRKVSSKQQKPDKYKVLVEKLMLLEPCDWPKFPEPLKDRYSAEIIARDLTTNTHNTAPKISIDDLKTLAKIVSTGHTKYSSSIQMPTLK